MDESTASILREIASDLEPRERAVDIVLIDDKSIREINRDYRGRDAATDVISFSYLEDGGPAQEEDIVGEIYISLETVRREASELGVDWKHLFLRIGVHGLLHVVGYEHGTDDDAERMERQERKVLSRHLGSDALEALF